MRRKSKQTDAAGRGFVVSGKFERDGGFDAYRLVPCVNGYNFIINLLSESLNIARTHARRTAAFVRYFGN